MTTMPLLVLPRDGQVGVSESQSNSQQGNTSTLPSSDSGGSRINTGSFDSARSDSARSNVSQSETVFLARRYEHLLADLPPPQDNPALRVAFSLMFGTGVRWNHLYVVNLVLIAVMVTGAICEIARTIREWNYLDISNIESTRAVVGLSLRWGMNYLVILLSFVPTLQTTFFIHLNSRDYGLRRKHFPASNLRLKLAQQDKAPSPYATWNRSWFRRHMTTILVVLSIALGISDLICLYRFIMFATAPLYYPLATGSDGQAIEVFAFVFWPWALTSSGIWVTTFYAISDDLVMVCHSVEQKIYAILQGCYDNHFRQGDACHKHPGMEPCHIQVIELLSDLKEFIDLTVRTTKIWFVFHMSLSFIVVVVFIISNVFILLAHGDGHQFRENFYTALIAIGVIFGYIVPLHAAARITNSWKTVVHSLLTDRRLLCHHPTEYQCFYTYLTELKGGFTVFGYPLMHRTGLQIMTVLVAIAGLSRFININ